MQQYPCSGMTFAQAAELFVLCIPSSGDEQGASLVDVLELVHDSEGAQATQLPFAVWYICILTALQSACGSTILLEEVARAVWYDKPQVCGPFPIFRKLRQGCLTQMFTA